MDIIADLHIHGRYSRACSKDLSIDNLEKYGKIKGIDLLGTGDFTHPEWIKELKSKLIETEKGSGIYQTKTGFKFMLATEISLIYSHDNKGRRVHHVVLAPNLEVVGQITDELKKHGRVDYDGRPIFGIPSPDFAEMLMNISKDIEIIPAHIWTPWFSIFGSKSGFDTVEECFQDKAKHIHALETGMSSNPAMNWRISALDKYNLVSFSDSHSFWPWRLGREATIFDVNSLTYKNIIEGIRNQEKTRETIEVDPGYGKYHLDGHRKCNVCLEPKESIKLGGKCPKCKRDLTIGVLARVEELADREEGYKLKGAHPFKTLIPLSELIANLSGNGLATKKTWEIYSSLLKMFKSEYFVLLNAKKEDLEKISPALADIIIKNRNGELKIAPGYDGEYGYPVFTEKEKQNYKEFEQKKKSAQKTLANF